MAITDTTTPYEILIRYGPDGAFQGAHVQTLRTIKDGETVLATTVSDAMDLGDQSDPAFQEVLGQALTDALAGNAVVKGERDAHAARLDELAAATVQAQTERDDALAAQTAAQEAQAVAEAALAAVQAKVEAARLALANGG